MSGPPEADAEEGSTATHIIERGYLVGHEHRVVQRKDDDRNAETDARRHSGGVGQNHHRVERVRIVQGVFRDPEIAETQLIGADCRAAHALHLYRRPGAAGQHEAKLHLVFECHDAVLLARPTNRRRA